MGRPVGHAAAQVRTTPTSWWTALTSRTRPPGDRTSATATAQSDATATAAAHPRGVVDRPTAVAEGVPLSKAGTLRRVR